MPVLQGELRRAQLALDDGSDVDAPLALSHAAVSFAALAFTAAAAAAAALLAFTAFIAFAAVLTAAHGCSHSHLARFAPPPVHASGPSVASCSSSCSSSGCSSISCTLARPRPRPRQPARTGVCLVPPRPVL